MRSKIPTSTRSPSWLLSDDQITKKLGKNIFAVKVDEEKLVNLIRRRGTYGDITQNATEGQLRYLMIQHENEVPQVIRSLKEWVNIKKTQTYIPPAFYGRDGNFFQPPAFEMPILRQR